MLPPYKPLDSNAILPRFRPIAPNGRPSLLAPVRYNIHDVKQLYDFNDLPRFERVRGFAQYIAARKRPAGRKRSNQGRLSPSESWTILQDLAI